MLETLAAFTLAEHMGNLAFVGNTGPAGYARLLSGGRQIVGTADGHVSLLPYTPRHWQAFFEAVDRPDLIEQFGVSSRAALNARIRELYALVQELGPTRTTAEWLALCERLDIPATSVWRLEELPQHPHLVAVGLFATSEHPTEGTLRQVRPTTLVDGSAPPIRRPAPSLGEHTAEVLREAGFTEAEINSLAPARS